MDKKVVLTAAIVVAFLLSSSILVLFYNQDTEDKEINLIARVNTEGSGIYIDAKYEASDFIVVDSEGNPLPDADGNIQYHKEFWEGKIFGTPGPTAIQHVQLRQIVESMGYTFTVYPPVAIQSISMTVLQMRRLSRTRHSWTEESSGSRSTRLFWRALCVPAIPS